MNDQNIDQIQDSQSLQRENAFLRIENDLIFKLSGSLDMVSAMDALSEAIQKFNPNLIVSYVIAPLDSNIKSDQIHVHTGAAGIGVKHLDVIKNELLLGLKTLPTVQPNLTNEWLSRDFSFSIFGNQNSSDVLPKSTINVPVVIPNLITSMFHICSLLPNVFDQVELDQIYRFVRSASSSILRITSLINVEKERAVTRIRMETLEYDLAKAKELERTKDEFLRLASHHLRTPVTSIKWYVEILKTSKTLSPADKANLDTIDNATERTIVLINTLLNVTELETGRVSAKVVDTDLNKLMKDVLAEQKVELGEANITFTKDDSLPHIDTDPGMVKEIMRHLLKNAVTYSPKNATITITLTAQGQNLVLKLSDTGYGIPESEQSKVFSKFFRGSNVTKLDTLGTGLGLFICKSLATTLKAKIWFESQENKGSTFYVSFPFSASTSPTT